MSSPREKHISLLVLLFLIGMSFPAWATPPAGQTWNLVWGDEFSGTTIDANLWGSGQKPWGTTDNSPCRITPEDSYLENGNLVLRTRAGSFNGLNYSCGWVYSKVWHTYGYMEIRAQYPAGKGQWPAWWMLRDGWPPEFDIAEFRGASGPSNDYMTQAVYDEAAQWTSSTFGGDYTGWHVYGFEWGPGYLKWYIDGVLTKTVNDPDIPTQAMYTILSAGLDSTADASTVFPNYYVIDYFRCYQKPPATAPSAPGLVTATTSSNQINLSWPAVDGAASYRIKRSSVSGGPYTTIATTTGLTESRYTDTNVVDFSTYYYVVSAVNAIGESANSAQITTMPTPPPISTGDPATASTTEAGRSPSQGNDGDATTRWTASSGTYPQWWRVDLGSAQTLRKVTINWENSGAANKYRIETSNDDVIYTTVVDQTGRTATGNSTEIFTASARYVRVTVTGSNGGWASFYECQVFGGTPPGTPSGLAATTVSANQVNLSWTAGSGAASYAVKRATVSGGPYATVAGAATTSYSDTGLTGNTTYYYVISALSSGGESGNTSQASATTLTAPPAPTGLAATAVSTSQVNLSWNASAGATSYTIKRAATSGGPYSTVANGLATASYSNTGLSAGTSYYFVVTAVNANGESVNSNQAATTTTPPAPTGLTATAAYAQVALSWDAALGAASYNIKRATTSSGPYTTIATGLTTLTFTNTGLPNDTPYYYVISAVNGSGESGDSTFATATPSSAPYLLTQGLPATSSTFQGGHEPAYGNDGDTSTRWTASSGTFPQWWKVDLGSIQNISSATIRWEGSATRAYKFRIETSNNDVNYTTAVDETARTAMGDSTDNFSASGRYVRITVTGVAPAGSRASFYECSIYGTPGTPGTPPPVPTGLIAAAVSSSQINLSWTASGGATGYNIKRATTNGGPYTAVATGVAATSYSNTGLTGGTTYYYAVTAVNANSESSISTQASAITAPGAPTGLTVTAGDAQATLSWPVATGAASYNVKRATVSGGPFTTIGTGVTALNYTSTGLVNGTTYYYVISAVNTTGEGANSSQVSATPIALLSQGQPATASSTEAGRSPSNGNDGSISTRWTASGGGYPQWWKVDLGAVQTISKAIILWESSATRSYQYLIEISNDNVSYTTLVDQSARTAMGDSTDTFSASARYVRVTVTGSSGGWASFFECSIYGLAGVQPTPPNAPTGLSATAISTSQINLGWTASSGASSYNVKRTTTNGGPYTTLATGVATTSYTNTGLAAGTTYYYVVSAVNANGESADSTQGAAITIPAAPTGLTATAGNTQATLNWTATTGAASYTIKRATVSGGPYTSIATGITTLSYTNTGLANGTIYYYVISAVNATGESANSAQASVTPAVVPILLSVGKPATASTFQTGNGVANGNDGSLSTRWTASGGGFPQWWRVDLSSVRSIDSVTINWENSANVSYKYRIEVSNDDLTYTTAVDQTARTATGNTTDTFAASARYVRVTVTGSSGGGWASFYELQVFGITPPATPAGLSATTASSSQLNLSWTAAGGAATYNVKRATVSGGPYLTIASNVTGTSYNNTGLSGGTSYYYVVSSVNNGGESADSSQASATTQPPPPMALDISISNDHQNCVLSWPSQAGWSYRVWTSTNLLTWLPLETKTGTGEKLEYNYTGLTNDPARYWRVESKQGSF